MSASQRACVLCAEPITPTTDSAEHVIPQAIGGRWKVRGFVCRACNNKAGERSDAVLARQLAWVASVVGVQRERGLAPDVAVTTGEGEALFLRHDGAYVARRPSVVTTTDGDQVNVQITGRSLDEVTQHARAIKKRHPKANVDEAIAGMTRARRYVDSPFQIPLALGGTEANVSLIKTALAAAHGAGMDLAACDRARAYLRTFEGQPPVNFFFSRELIPHRPPGRLLLIVSIQTDMERRRAWAYIEYFGLWRSVVVLSTCYAGPPVQSTYAIDPVAGQEVALELKETLTDVELQGVLDGVDESVEAWQALYARTMPQILARAEERHQERLLMEAAEEAATSLGVRPGDDVDGDMAQALAQRTRQLAEAKLAAMAAALARQCSSDLVTVSRRSRDSPSCPFRWDPGAP